MDYQIFKNLVVTHIQLYPTHKRFIKIAQSVLLLYNNPPKLLNALKTQANALYSPLVRREVLDLYNDINQLWNVKELWYNN